MQIIKDDSVNRLKNKLSIRSGSATILVREASQECESEFESWLRSEGFSRGREHKGHYGGVDWIYINLNEKCYVKGIPGVALTVPFGKHAITIEEFKTIYHIYRRYEGLDMLRMSQEEQKMWDRKIEEYEKENKAYWKQITFKSYQNEICEKLASYIHEPKEEILRYLETEQNDMIKEAFRKQERAESLLWSLYMLW